MSQVLDASAIKEVRDMAFSTLLEERLSSADCPAVALPESVRIHSLENLQDRRFRFRGKMETASILDFSRYCKDYAGERRFRLRYSVLTGGNAPVLVLRIVQLETAEELMATEFRELLEANFTDVEVETFIGEFKA